MGKRKKRPVLLNLGANRRAQPGWINVDIEPFPGIDVVCDLEQKWPWPDDSVDGIQAADLIEHLHKPVHTMNEAWRVLKHGGRFEILVPSTEGRGAHQDPTHVSFWNENSFGYYAVSTDADGRWVSHSWRTLYVPHLIKAAFEWIEVETTPDVGAGIIYVRAIGLAVKEPIYTMFSGEPVLETELDAYLQGQNQSPTAPSGFLKV